MDWFYSAFAFLFRSTGPAGIDRTAVWTVIVGAAAIAVAWRQLASIKKISRADFLQRFSKEFFGKETRDLFTLLMNSCLIFEVRPIKNEGGQEMDHLPCLIVDPNVYSQINDLVSLDEARIGYNAFEVDDLLLGYFDDIGWYEKRGLIDMESVDQMFGYYVVNSLENEEIKKYLNHPDNQGKYDDCRYIYGRCKALE